MSGEALRVNYVGPYDLAIDFAQALREAGVPPKWEPIRKGPLTDAVVFTFEIAGGATIGTAVAHAVNRFLNGLLREPQERTPSIEILGECRGPTSAGRTEPLPGNPDTEDRRRARSSWAGTGRSVAQWRSALAMRSVGFDDVVAVSARPRALTMR